MCVGLQLAQDAFLESLPPLFLTSTLSACTAALQLCVILLRSSSCCAAFVRAGLHAYLPPLCLLPDSFADTECALGITAADSALKALLRLSSDRTGATALTADGQLRAMLAFVPSGRDEPRKRRFVHRSCQPLTHGYL